MLKLIIILVLSICIGSRLWDSDDDNYHVEYYGPLGVMGPLTTINNNASFWVALDGTRMGPWQRWDFGAYAFGILR